MAGGHIDIPVAGPLSVGPPSGPPVALYDVAGNLPASSEEWQDRGAAVGTREEYDANGKLVVRQVQERCKRLCLRSYFG